MHLARDAFAAWLADDAGDAREAHYEPLAIDDTVHVAMGWTRYVRQDGSVDHEYSNIFLCRFDEASQCSEFMEWWMPTCEAAPDGDTT